MVFPKFSEIASCALN